MREAASARAPVFYTIRLKFTVALLLALAWTTFSIWVSRAWVEDLGNITHPMFAMISITFIAYVPGFMNAFLLFTLLFDHRPPRKSQPFYPPLTILIAAYQEEAAIADTLESIASQDYRGAVEVLILNDGSTDRTAEVAQRSLRRLPMPASMTARILDFPVNRGKATALNDGLRAARHPLIVTIDGDSCLREDSLTHIVERLLSDPPETQAVAGAVMVRNPPGEPDRRRSTMGLLPRHRRG